MSYPSPAQAPRGAVRSRPRRDRGPASLTLLVVLASVSVLAYIALSLVFAPPDAINSEGTAVPANFKSERGSITLLSSGMFKVAAVAAAFALARVRRSGGRDRVLWLAFTVIMTYFSVDEVLQFHEAAGDFLDAHFTRGPFRTYNDVVVIAYGVVALPLALFLWRTVLRHPRLFPMLVVTGTLYVATTAVDSLSKHPTPVSVVLEEGIKVCCSTFFALSMITGLVAARWLHREPGAEPAGASPGRADARGPVLAIWTALLALMAVDGLLVVVVTRPGLRLPLNWLAALALGAVVVRAVARLDHGPRPARG